MGLLAVLGAIVVGIMQVRILKRQSEIAADQYQLQQQQLRSELYQNRAEVYAVAHDWFDVALADAKWSGFRFRVCLFATLQHGFEVECSGECFL